MLNQTKGIFFDFGGILFSSDIAKMEDYSVLNKYGINVDKFNEFFKELRIKAQTDKDYSLNDARWNALKNFVSGAKLEEIIANLKSVDQKKEYKLFPNVKKTLKRLDKRNYVLGLITNVHMNEQEVRDVLRKKGIDNHFDTVICSKDVGIRKPDPRIYYTALRQANLNPGECFFVAHDYFELKTASDIGTGVIAFKYSGSKKLDFVKKKNIIERFEEIPFLV